MIEEHFVPKQLDELKKLYIERNARYKDTHKEAGKIFEAIFGQMVIKNDYEWGRIAILLQIIGKLVRYKNMFYEVYPGVDDENFDKVQDCLKDIAVYSTLLMELDHEAIENDEYDLPF